MLKRLTVSIYLVGYLGLCTALGQNPLDVLSTTDGGSAYELCYHNERLYVGCANTLEVFTLNGPNFTPDATVFKKRLLSNIDQIIVHDGFLFVCANHDGLYKFDLSDPNEPVELAHYQISDPSASIYDLAFKGDTILVAAKSHVELLLNSGTSITYLSTLASYPDPGRIRGLDIKGDLLAYAVGYTPASSEDGVYLFDLNSMNQLDHFPDTDGDPLEVYFGQNTDLLHVMGGALSNTLFHGRYYALNISASNTMNMVYQDTIKGLALIGSIASPMSAVLINDTIYVSTHGGGPINPTFSFTGQVYVYDARNSNNISLLTDIYAGLYHFDTDIRTDERVMYVASEWYGILSVDIADIYNEVDLGKTLTGGWCHGSSYAGNRLVEANEGYGLRLYDLTDIRNPVFLAEDTAVGFCRAISQSNTGDFVYGWYLTNQGLRVFDGNTLNPIADVAVPPFAKSDFKKSRHHNGTLAVILNAALAPDRIVVADVNTPTAPTITHTRIKPNLKDLLFIPTGELFICAKDSILVLDPANMNILSAVTPPLGGFQPYDAFTFNNDTLYVHYSGVGEGIARYAYDVGTQTLSYIDAYPFSMESTDRIFMASNDSLLFISSTLDSLKAIRKHPPHTQVMVYDHGADFIFDGLWGVQELYVKDDYLFLNEYMGQTTIFGEDISTTIRDGQSQELDLWYDQRTAALTIVFGQTGKRETILFDASGRSIWTGISNSTSTRINLSEVSAGAYIVVVHSENGSLRNGRFVVP